MSENFIFRRSNLQTIEILKHPYENNWRYTNVQM